MSQLNVTQAGTIVGAGFLEFRIVHTCRGDVELQLRHPDGTIWTAQGPDDCADVWEGPLEVPAGWQAVERGLDPDREGRPVDDAGVLEAGESG